MVRFATLPRDRWRTVVASLAELGFNAIDVPLVWREHERAAGQFDLSSGTLSLQAMAAAVREAGLRLIIRLGPMVTDDAPGLCLPERILRARACQARTRRQNPVYVPDPPRAVPLPSIASEAFRHEARAWISAAATAVASLGPDAADRMIVGDGPHALLRDDPFELDHHPDAHRELASEEPSHGHPHDAGLAEVRRESAHQVAYREQLVEAAIEAGLARERIFCAVAGAATISPAAHILSRTRGLSLALPPPTTGSLSIWRQVRHALALTESKGVHFDLWSGGAPYYPPTRGSHTVAAARVALAAGAREFTVRMGCAGDRWVGAVLSEQGHARPHAPLWRELLAWAATLPSGDEVCAELIEPEALVEAARAATSVHPLPMGLLALLGLLPGEIATRGAAWGEGNAIDRHESAISTAERALIAAGIPFRRTPYARAPVALNQGEEPAAFIARAVSTLGHQAPRIEPPGAALVRLVNASEQNYLIALSCSAETVCVTPSSENWSVATPGPVESTNATAGIHAVAGTSPANTLELAPGAVAVFVQTIPSAAPKPPALLRKKTKPGTVRPKQARQTRREKKVR